MYIFAKLTPFYFSLQVKNKPYKPTGKYVFILENDAVANNMSLSSELVRPVEAYFKNWRTKIITGIFLVLEYCLFINIKRNQRILTLVLTALFIYFISLPKVTYGLSFKVICDLRP